MPQLVVAAVGYAASAAAGGGFLGAIVGAGASALASSLLTPTQKVVGPRLGDLSVGGSSYGAVIPYIEGHPRIAGQIIWASTKREISQTNTEGGKGGGGTRVTTFTYEVDVLILVTCHEIAGVTRGFSGGDLIFNATTGGDGVSIINSYNTPQWTRMTVYGGGPTQLPDPDYAASVGEDNALAYRTRGTIFIKGLKLGNDGVIPNLTWEVVRHGTVGLSNTVMIEAVSGVNNVTDAYATEIGFGEYHVDTANYKFGSGSLTGTNGDGFDDGAGGYLPVTVERMRRQFPGITTEPAGKNWTMDGWIYLPAYPTFGNHLTICTLTGVAALQVDSNGCLWPSIHPNTIDFWLNFFGNNANNTFSDIGDSNYPTANRFPFYENDFVTPYVAVVSHNPTVIPLDTWVHVAIYRYEGRIFTRAGEAGEHEHGWTPSAFHISTTFPSPPAIYHTTGASPFLQANAYGGGTMHWYYAISLASHKVADEQFVEASGDDPQSRFTFGDGTGSGIDYRLDAFRLSDEAIFVPRSAFVHLGSGDAGVFISGGEEGGWSDAAPTPDAYSVSIYNYDVHPTLLPVDPTVAEVVSRLCTERAGIESSQFSVLGIESITTRVHGMVLSQPSTVRQDIEMLAACYFFESVLSDKLYFRARAGAANVTIAYEELGWAVDGQSFAEQLPLKVANELELPAQIALVYASMEGDYQTDTQYSDRMVTGQQNTEVIQFPLGLTAQEAKQRADAILTDRYVALVTAQISLNLSRSELEPTDPVLIRSKDGSLYRQRLLKRQDSDCILLYDVVLDDATVFTQLGLTVGGTDSQSIVAGIPDTDMLLLDIPLLRDEDNMPGIYEAVKGRVSLGWHSESTFDSTDNVSYALENTIDSQAVFGTATGILQDWTGACIFDEVSWVLVDVGEGQLESYSRADMLNNMEVGAAVIGSELVQYRTALLISPGVYRLSSFIRGRRGTEWAMVDHIAGERFLLIGNSGMRFLPLSTSDLGVRRYYKAVTAGQRLSAVVPQSIYPISVNLIPWSPVNLRADRDGIDTVLSCIRRTRLSTRVGGPLAQSIPLGEVTESYRWDIFEDDTFAVILRTVLTDEPELTYTPGQQATDFGSPIPLELSVKVRQMSDAVGGGYSLRGTV